MTPMKKLSAVLLLALAGTLSSLSAQTGNVAVGPVYSIDYVDIESPLHGWGNTGKIPGLSPVWGLNLELGTERNFLGVTADWLLYRQPVYTPANLNFYMGPGVYSSILVTDTARADLGLRIPFGVTWVPLKFLEAFAELTPAFGFKFENPVKPTWLFQSAVGGRIWF